MIISEEYDDCTSTIVEVRPGVGGGESSLFADDILSMIQGYSAEMGWNCKVGIFRDMLDYNSLKGYFDR